MFSFKQYLYFVFAMIVLLTLEVNAKDITPTDEETTRIDQWKADLAEYHQTLQSRHIDLYNQITPSVFEEELNKIENSINKATDWEIATRLMQLTRKIGDGHTSVSIQHWDINRFPFKFEKISGQWRVTEVSNHYPQLLKATLQSINGSAISDVEQALAKVVQFVENPHSTITRVGAYMRNANLLHALGTIDSDTEGLFTFSLVNGNTISLPISALNRQAFQAEKSVHIERKTPEIMKPEQTEFDFFWFTQLKTKKTTYVNFSGYPSFDKMTALVEKLIAVMSANQIEKVVIDMRENEGGDLYVGIILAHGLNLVDSIDWLNGVYVLTSAKTFSAGTSNAALFRELLNAKIVGVPTGSNPTGYQDMDEFTLQHSNLRVTYSKRLFKIQETKTEGLIPDIIITPDWHNVQQGIDTTLGFVLSAK